MYCGARTHDAWCRHGDGMWQGTSWVQQVPLHRGYRPPLPSLGLGRSLAPRVSWATPAAPQYHWLPHGVALLSSLRLLSSLPELLPPKRGPKCYT